MPGENNNLPVRSYQKQFKQLLQAVYHKQSYFAEFFGGSVEVLDGVENNKTAFSVKTSDIPVVVGTEYNKDKEVGFGTGTEKSGRFGNRTEVIYTDTDVDYDWEWVYHEGVDRYTVNNNFDSSVADRLDLQAQAKVQLFDNKGGAFISKVANETKQLADFSNENVLRLFNDLSNAYVNMEAIGSKMAWVVPELYNAIVDHPLTTTSKSSAANIDENGILRFKGFTIKETPDAKFQTGEVAYTSIVNVGKQFTGINTARAMETTEFDGQVLQGAGKAGEYILPANKKAVIKVTKTP
ncbi:phage capsid protein [Dellaglioa algida]|uniref:phage capsid protein n=1 Tax=Dellaglioa algida TaxID=105612 RepID=UPI0024C48554|nr:phage capsid protein [Dellaglioa algida]MDK1718706.1 phage capsid protein [Dellaglioa algida]